MGEQNTTNYESFMAGLKQEAPKSNTVLTENGAVVYATSGDHLVDLMSSATSLRNASPEEAMKKIELAFYEDKILAIKLLFQMGDIREGKGERRFFNMAMDWMAKNHPAIAKEVMDLIPEYTRWDYLVRLTVNPNKEVSEKALNIIKEQLAADQQTDTPSLLGKWMPSLQSKDKEKQIIAHKLIKELKMSYKDYRKTLSGLRDKLNIIEKYLSTDTLEQIDQEKLTAKQQLLYGKIMDAKIPEVRKEYFEKVLKGEAKINASVLTPIDIVHTYERERGSNPILFLETLWKNLPDKIEGNGNTLVIRDGSGSMTCGTISPNSSATMLEAATALTIYCAERLSGPFKDKFITFSNYPKVVDVSNCDSLSDKLSIINRHGDCSNTNFEATCDLILDIAIKNHLKQEEIPKYLMILSDMEFDEAMDNSIRWGEKPDTLFDTIRAKWAKAGYELPGLIFWQLNGERTIYPEIDNKNGIIYLSGYSTNTLDMVMRGDFEVTEVNKETGEVKTTVKSPFEQLVQILSNTRYDAIEQAAKIGLSKEVNENTVEAYYARQVDDSNNNRPILKPQDNGNYDDIDEDIDENIDEYDPSDNL